MYSVYIILGALIAIFTVITVVANSERIERLFLKSEERDLIKLVRNSYSEDWRYIDAKIYQNDKLKCRLHEAGFFYVLNARNAYDRITSDRISSHLESALKHALNRKKRKIIRDYVDGVKNELKAKDKRTVSLGGGQDHPQGRGEAYTLGSPQGTSQ